MNDKVRHADWELVDCDYKDCSEYGEYTTCYLGLSKSCMKYQEYMEMLVRKFDDSKLEESDE